MRLCRRSASFCLCPHLGEFDVVAGPEIPVGDFLVEAFVEFGTVEGLLPRGLEFRPVGEVMLLVQLGEGEIEKDFDVGAVRVGDADVFDERDFFEAHPWIRRVCGGGGG